MRSSGKREHAKREDKTHLKRCLRVSCGVCGHCEELPLDKEGASSFVQPRKRRKVAASDADMVVPPSAPALTAKSGEAAHALDEPIPAGRIVQDVRQNTPTHNPIKPSLIPSIDSTTRRSGTPTVPAVPTSARSKSRPKKSSGLQGLLARSREKQEQEKRLTGNSSGLSAFLQELG